MKLISIAVLDLATETYGRPFFVHHAGQAMRSFMDEVKNRDSEIGKHPGDYELYELGTFDDTTGKFTAPPEPVRLLRGSDFKE
ncbi:MAG: nonstructural protein [Arizlama microvirus]|nr:MAG: nonstructural protein [Arizlama microvirus]